jgi:hypothetical protein
MAIKTTAKRSSFLCLTQVMHKRLKPSINKFLYRVFYLCFDIKNISEISSKFLSLNKFNLFSFYNKDHGKRDNSSLDEWIRKILAQHFLDQKTKKIFLLTYPRVLGYVFNPVSFWFCIDEKENLLAVLSEVNNTFKGNHNYLIFNHDHSPIQENQWLEAKKEFYVSPFFAVEGFYKFRFIFNQKKIAAWINYYSPSQEKKLLTSIICQFETLCDLVLLKQFFLIPLMTFKVIFLIHYQALKLLIKRNKICPR